MLFEFGYSGGFKFSAALSSTEPDSGVRQLGAVFDLRQPR